MKARPGDERTLRDSAADTGERVAALSRLTSDRRLDLEREVRALLEHPEPRLRAEAASTLVGRWWREEDVDDVVAVLHDDPHYHARAGAAAALAMFVQRTGKQRERLVRELVTALRADEDAITQRAIYEDLLRLLAPDRDWVGVPADFDPARDADWDLLEPYA